MVPYHIRVLLQLLLAAIVLVPGAWGATAVQPHQGPAAVVAGEAAVAALEALPAASPDEVPAEVAPGVEPAAPGLEAMPGARCRRRPGLGPRSGAVPAGRADAQRVGSLQAAPARPRLGLQLPQLDQLHGPGRCAAAGGRGPDREWPPRGGNGDRAGGRAGARPGGGVVR